MGEKAVAGSGKGECEKTESEERLEKRVVNRVRHCRVTQSTFSDQGLRGQWKRVSLWLNLSQLCDPRWVTSSPQTLPLLCRMGFLPLPQDYREGRK